MSERHPLGCYVVEELQRDDGRRYRIWSVFSTCDLPHPMDVDMFYLLWCKVCEPEQEANNAIPFESPAARGKWAAAHAKALGHDSWLVIDHEPELIAEVQSDD